MWTTCIKICGISKERWKQCKSYNKKKSGISEDFLMELHSLLDKTEIKIKDFENRSFVYPQSNIKRKGTERGKKRNKISKNYRTNELILHVTGNPDIEDNENGRE